MRLNSLPRALRRTAERASGKKKGEGAVFREKRRVHLVWEKYTKDAGNEEKRNVREEGKRGEVANGRREKPAS